MAWPLAGCRHPAGPPPENEVMAPGGGRAPGEWRQPCHGRQPVRALGAAPGKTRVRQSDTLGHARD